MNARSLCLVAALAFVLPTTAIAASPPSWSKVIQNGSSRFKVLKQFADQAVLDKETGIVWERSPDPTTRNWHDSVIHCYRRNVGGRMGWRMATIEELTSLIDQTQANPALPAGHPFIGIPTAGCAYWSATTRTDAPSAAWALGCNVGSVPFSGDKASNFDPAWCARGFRGHDGY